MNVPQTITIACLAVAWLVGLANIYAAVVLKRRYDRIAWWSWGSAALVILVTGYTAYVIL